MAISYTKFWDIEKKKTQYNVDSEFVFYFWAFSGR